ncbi:Fungal chitin synthase [Metarhizium rileyi]|uniref:chitin synthase n=1 Tax=Metarhizium rileyi (strain RCEF 4871) TaxID=1649241 RepID=A0A162HZN4_METRR|nr:Fungal chitin synthase [Metarhizium rileyi RCEF 4871]
MKDSTVDWPLPSHVRGLPAAAAAAAAAPRYGLHPPVSIRKPGSSMLSSSESTLARATPHVAGSQTPRSVESATSIDSQFNTSNVSLWGDVRQEEAKLRWDAEEELKRVSKELLRLQKWALITGLVILNSALIIISLLLPQAMYLFLVLLSCNTMLQAGMVVCIVSHVIWSKILCGWRRKKKTANPTTPERMVLLLPCYNETKEEIARSLESLVLQKGIDGHPRLILIVVDGNVRGPGMDKTTQDYFLQDILEPGVSKHFQNGYRARDGLFMPVNTRVGQYKGIPFVFVGKRYNQGKRDSLCFARSFLYHFKKRSGNAVTIFNRELFEYLGNCLLDKGLADVDYLVGMDADTVFDEVCIAEMVKTIRENPKLVGVCGHVCVDFDGRSFGPWSLYQSVEYSQTQGLRRMFQSRITGKVNCLPGCCQLIKVDEATFGDTVLRERFGYCPKPNDVMTQQIMGNYSEDSIHASIIFSLFPKKQTAQALRSKAFTIVPQTWGVFLSQRKRWALGSISNEFVMIFRPGIILVERLQSIIAVTTWAITPFIISAVAQLIVLFVKKGVKVFEDKVFVGLISVLWIRYLYSFCIGFWLPRNNLERLQYFVGFFVHFLTSPFMNIIILIYSLLYADDFKWGKTREVITADGEKGDGLGGRGTH